MTVFFIKNTRRIPIFVGFLIDVILNSTITELDIISSFVVKYRLIAKCTVIKPRTSILSF